MNEFAKMPLHGRQDLYPIPKEKGHEHGDSYYEEVGWWKGSDISLSGVRMAWETFFRLLP